MHLLVVTLRTYAARSRGGSVETPISREDFPYLAPLT